MRALTRSRRRSPTDARHSIGRDLAQERQPIAAGLLRNRYGPVRTAYELDLVGIEYTRVATPTGEPAWFQTIWLARFDAVAVATGTRYMFGYGAVIDPEPYRELARKVDPEDHVINIGGAG